MKHPEFESITLFTVQLRYVLSRLKYCHLILGDQGKKLVNLCTCTQQVLCSLFGLTTFRSNSSFQLKILYTIRNSTSPVERRKNDIAHGLKIGIGATRDYNLIGVVCQSGFKISSNLTTHIHENKSQRTSQPFKTIPIQYFITPAGAHLRAQSEHVNYLLVKIHQFNWILTK